MFNKFIEEDIDPKHDNVTDPSVKLIKKKYNLSKEILSNMNATGIETKNGI